jgi:hypothetical protein
MSAARKYLSIVLILGALLFIAAVLAGLSPKPTQERSVENFVPTTESPASVTKEDKIAWKLTDLSEESQSGPLTEVSVIIEGKPYILGTYNLSCAEGNWPLLDNEISAVQCMWGGAGYEFGVFVYEPGRYIVKRGVLDEPTAETSGVRGMFEVMFVLP